MQTGADAPGKRDRTHTLRKVLVSRCTDGWGKMPDRQELPEIKLTQPARVRRRGVYRKT